MISLHSIAGLHYAKSRLPSYPQWGALVILTAKEKNVHSRGHPTQKTFFSQSRSLYQTVWLSATQTNKQTKSPDPKPSSNSDLPVAWITGPATDPSHLHLSFFGFEQTICYALNRHSIKSWPLNSKWVSALGHSCSSQYKCSVSKASLRTFWQSTSVFLALNDSKTSLKLGKKWQFFENKCAHLKCLRLL
jgi:hypothetical protein